MLAAGDLLWDQEIAVFLVLREKFGSNCPPILTRGLPCRALVDSALGDFFTLAPSCFRERHMQDLSVACCRCCALRLCREH